MIEMNCETDFVARNKKFQSLVQKITNGCQLFSNSSDQHSPSAILSKIPLSGEELANIPLAENRMVKDEIALSIGEVGENIKTRRAVCFKSSGPVLLVGYTHPAPEGISANAKEFYCSGKYGAIVAFRPTESKSKSEKRSRSQESLTLVGKQLCQHVVGKFSLACSIERSESNQLDYFVPGMNPKEIGSMEQPVVAQQGEKPNVVVESSGVNQDSSVAVSNEEEGKPDAEIDETVLVNQEFLLDPDITVREFLIQNSIEVLDYIRFECGESVSDSICE